MLYCPLMCNITSPLGIPRVTLSTATTVFNPRRYTCKTGLGLDHGNYLHICLLVILLFFGVAEGMLLCTTEYPKTPSYTIPMYIMCYLTAMLPYYALEYVYKQYDSPMGCTYSYPRSAMTTSTRFRNPYMQL